MASRSAVTRDLTGFFILTLATATIGPLLFGFHLAELNAPLDVLTCASRDSDNSSASAPALPQCIPMNITEISLVSAIFTLGGLIGALVSGPLSSAYGRLYTMRLNTALLALGPVAETLAPSVAIMALGRFVSGLGAGAAVVVVPIYIAEISPPSKRGLFGAFTQIMTNLGIFIAQLLGLFLSKGQLWRIILAVGGAFGLLQFAGLLFSVESPSWMATKGHLSRAREALQRIRGPDYDIADETNAWSHHDASHANGEERALLADERTESTTPQLHESPAVGIFEIVLDRRYTRAVVVVMGVMLAQQLCGINSIVMYGVTLLSDLLTASSALLNVFVAIVNLSVTLLCAPLVDRLGRRACLIASICGMGTSSLLLGIAIMKHIPALSVVAVLTFVASFGLGLGPIPFILASELVGPEAVGATQSWALAANWLGTFAVSFFFPILNEKLSQGRVYFLFAGLAALFATFVALFLPESAGKRDADEVWGRKDPEQFEHED